MNQNDLKVLNEQFDLLVLMAIKNILQPNESR